MIISNYYEFREPTAKPDKKKTDFAYIVVNSSTRQPNRETRESILSSFQEGKRESDPEGGQMEKSLLFDIKAYWESMTPLDIIDAVSQLAFDSDKEQIQFTDAEIKLTNFDIQAEGIEYIDFS